MSILNVSVPLQIRSDAEPIDPSIVQLLVSEATTNQYFNVALTTVLVYHSVITLDEEIKYFWPNPRSSVSIIYFANRYTGLLAATCNITFALFTESLARCGYLLSCLFSYWAGSLANLVTIVVIDYILLIWVLALWDQDRKLSIILKILLGLDAGAGLGILIYVTLLQNYAVGSLAEGMTICGRDKNPPRIVTIVSWLVPMSYGLILMYLALYKAARYWRLSSGFEGFHLVRVLIQDQVIYFGLIIDISVIEIRPFAADVLSAAGNPTLLCILGGQLLINLKQAGERGANGGTNYTPTSVSDINFGESGSNDDQISDRESSV